MLLTQIGPPAAPHQPTEPTVVPLGTVSMDGLGRLGIVRPIVVGAVSLSEPIAQPLVFVNVPVIETAVLFWLTDAGAMTRWIWHPVPVPTDSVDNCDCSANGCENALPAKACGVHAPQVVGLPEI